MKVLRFVLTVAVAFTLIKCAQQRSLTGGEQDTTPPKILHSIPTNYTTGFIGQTIMMEFDEYVLVKSLSSELVTSPPLRYPVEYRIKGHRVYFDLKDTLQPNTTYNFNFGNAIVDLNQSNPLDSNLFVFSTGDFIDSGFVTGLVKDAYTLKPVKGATVMLFPATEDSAIYHGGPKYITKTNAQGFYNLQYLQMIDYQIFVLEFPGSEYQYSPYTNVGFFPELINPIVNDSVDFFLFKEIDTSQYISKEFSRDYYSFVLGFHNDLVQPKFSFGPESDTINYVIEEIQPDSFKFWVEGDKDLDSAWVYVMDSTGYADTMGFDLDDRTKFYKKLKRKHTYKHPVKLTLNAKAGVFDYFDSLYLTMSRPPQNWNLDSVYFVHEKDTVPVDSLLKLGILYMELPYAKVGTTAEIRTMPIKYNWEPGQNYAFIFYSGAVTDLINQTNDTTILKFKTKSFEDYGSFRLTVKVADYDEPLILELLNNDGKFIRDYKIRSGDVIYHELAVPGKYQLRLIIDENGNNQWDTGELDKRIQPETLVYYNGVIEIRPNWDMEETWVVNFK